MLFGVAFTKNIQNKPLDFINNNIQILTSDPTKKFSKPFHNLINNAIKKVRHFLY